MPLHDLKMLLSHKKPWAKTHPNSSQERDLRLSGEDMSLGSESVSQLSLAGPGGRQPGACRFINYHSVFMRRSLAVFVGTEPWF